MPIYAYQAVDESLALVRGSVTAETPRQARDELRSRGLTVEQIAPKPPIGAGIGMPWRRRGRYDARLVPVVRELATLTSAAIPLADALDTVSRQQRGVIGDSLRQLRDRIAAGAGMADAMREQPYVYDELTIQMVEVGENAGNLDEVLDQLAGFRERYTQFKDRVLTALFYPLIVLAMGVAVSLFLMTFVVPMLLDNLLSAGQEIPWPTKILKAMSDLLRGYWFPMAAAASLLVAGWFIFLSTDFGKRMWHRTLLRLPLVGPLAMKQEVARAALIVSTLMNSGVVFVESLQIAARAVKNVVLRNALGTIEQRVLTGRDIGEAMDEAEVFPPLVVQIFTVGQQTGKLESMLARLAIDYERQVASLSMRIATAIEPLLIVVLAAFVGFILFATMLPILEAGNVL